MKDSIGLLGAGNMGTAILEGLLQKGVSVPGRIWVYDKMPGKAREFAKAWKVHCAATPGELVRKSRWIILAVKPQDLEALGGELRSSLSRQHGLISILAGTPAAKIRRRAGSKPAIVRAMPNLGAKTGTSMTAITGTSKPALKAAKTIFDACGKTLVLPERFFDLVTAVSGSGPAYFFYLMESLADFGRQQGLSPKDAELLAVQTALGASTLASAGEFSPAEWRERVTSKKGTTDAALKVMKKSGLQKILFRAFKAAMRRGRELSRT